ncbi:P-loop containing nucleoside triphosphate hydrolase protein [Wilcoxina mikolae CBS 423.85]|nr:P-loop containing nucleoside triphosphate hydrolase protein [Wilcoxina mikolae CBS 423.85]
MPKKNINITLLGSQATGKTALLTTYLFNVFPGYYAPTLDGVYASTAPNNPEHHVTFLEPGGIENLLQLRLPSTDVFVIAFSLVDKRTFQEAEIKWFPLAKSVAAPVVLVGCKKDLRPVVVSLKEELRREVMEGEGENMAWRMKAAAYCECSALTDEGVAKVFEVALRAAEGRK